MNDDDDTTAKHLAFLNEPSSYKEKTVKLHINEEDPVLSIQKAIDQGESLSKSDGLI